jgi:hypothetical protein
MDRLNVAFVVVRDGTDDDGAVEIDTGRGVERRPFLGLTWLPRLDQLLAFLARYGPFDLTVRPAGEGRRDCHWQVTLLPGGAGAGDSAGGGAGSPDAGSCAFRATTGGDAAGRALHYLLSEAGWRPGPAL